MGTLRFSLRVLAMLAGLLLLLPLHYGWRLTGADSPWPRRWLWWVGRAAGFKTIVRGTPLGKRVLFVANHLSWLDIMILAGATGAAFVSKDEVARWPVLGWLARLNRTIFVNRSERRAVHGQADAVRTALASGQPVALFPEGTTDGGTEVLPFRASLLSALFPPLPGIRVQPVALDYGAAAAGIAWVGQEAAADNARRVLSRRGTTQVTLHFLAPLDPSEAHHRKALAESSRSAIVAALGPSALPADRL
ncbi:MAG TPA: lysophospholipid acyltransferase family protein [Allosphingosinicella sp.]|nr:lysophospholipid acyltransferase family protein [Allosphingosinicella sp.]